MKQRKQDPRGGFTPFTPSLPLFVDVLIPDTPANCALLAAVRINNLAGVKRAFTQGANARAYQTQKRADDPPRLVASVTRSQTPPIPRTPLLCFVMARESDDSDKPQAIAIFREFLAHGADIQAHDSEGKSAIHLASVLGDVALVKEVLAKGASVNAAPSSGFGDPLHCAMSTVRRNKEGPELPLIAFLLERGANPNTYGPSGMTPLMVAAALNHSKTVVLLLKHGADPALVGKSTPRNSLMRPVNARFLAQRAGNQEIVRLLKAAPRPR